MRVRRAGSRDDSDLGASEVVVVIVVVCSQGLTDHVPASRAGCLAMGRIPKSEQQAGQHPCASPVRSRRASNLGSAKSETNRSRTLAAGNHAVIAW